MRVLLVYNPTAGGDETDLDPVVGLLEAAGHTVLSRPVKDDDWAAALGAEINLVAVAGGDGTVREVFKQLAGTSLQATLVPVGTANNIARSLGFPEVEEDAGRLIEGWAAGRRAWCDLGKLTFATGEELFIESAGGGLFGEVLVRAKKSETNREGEDKIEFGLRALREIVDEASPLSWGIRADGRDRSGELLGVAAMNVRELGPRVPAAPAADPGDGLLELTLIEPAHRSALADYLDARIEGRPAEAPAFDVSRASRIELEPPGGVPLHVDDELAEERGAIAIEVGAGLHVLVPAG